MRRIAKEEYLRYFPVGDRHRVWDAYVAGVGRIVRAFRGAPDRGHPQPYYYVWETGRVLNLFGMAYITHGQGEFESASVRRTVVDAGTVLLLLPDEWHRYRPSEQGAWSYYWVHFGGGYFDTLMKRGVLSAERPLFKPGLQQELLRSYGALVQRARTQPPGFQQMMCGNVLEILGMTLAAEAPGAEAERLGPLVRQAAVLLEQRMAEVVDLNELASSLDISYDRFRRAFKKHTGLSPHQYVLQLRVERARELLYATDLTVRQIAAELGFDDPYYFSRAFRKFVGLSPRQWRMETLAGNADRSTSPRRPQR